MLKRVAKLVKPITPRLGEKSYIGLVFSSQIARMSSVIVTPKYGLVDCDLTIRAEGLEKIKPYTLHMYLMESGHKYISCGHYVSDNLGMIDCVRDRCVGGSYDGVERHGLIWSMVQAPGQRQGLRLIPRDVTKPYDVHLMLYEGHRDLVTCYEQMDFAPIARTVFNRTYMGPGVQRELIRDGRIRGSLFKPAGVGPFPAVVDLFGSVGGLVELRAALMASHGIMSLHLAYFRYDDLPETMSLIDYDYFEEAVDFLLRHSLTKGTKVGVVGVSKGAEIAICMGANLPPHKLGAIVAINGFHYTYVTPAQYKGKAIPADIGDFEKTYLTESGSLVFAEAVRNYVEKEESTSKVENADAQYLLISSLSDQQIPPECSYKVVERLKRFGKNNYEHLALGEGVGHLVEPCHSPSVNESYHASFQSILAWGGRKRPHARAQEVAWPKILSFLKENLGYPGPHPSSKL